VFKKLLSRPHPIGFPQDILISRNYFHHKWSLKTLRRVKNVIVVLEWIPSIRALTVLRQEPKPTPVQSQKLAKAMEMLGLKGEASVTVANLRLLMTALGIEVSAEIVV
jgi:hypothetical protein